MTAATQEIVISNVGPIAHCSIPYLPDGGLVVLRGPQGCGKSTAGEALQVVATGKGKLSVKDGELSGRVEGLGVRLTIGARTTRSGEPLVTSIESRLSVADLVDPQIKDPAAADRHRIKALVTLAGVKPSPAMFYRLIGDRAAFEAVVKPASLEPDDLVQMAEAIKRDLEAAARKEADQAEHAEGLARGARDAAAGTDLTGECDQLALSNKLEAAIREQSRLSAEQEAATKAQRAAQIARDSIEDAEAAYQGPAVQDAVAAEEAAQRDAALQTAEVVRLESELAAARGRQAAANTAVATAIRARKQAESHEATLIKWREQITASVPDAPSAEQLEAATNRVLGARQKVESGAVIRRAQLHAVESENAIQEAAKHRKQSDVYRDAAKGTDEILSEAVAKTGSPLRVESGRLVIKTIRRGKTRFAELSDGERWIVGLDIAIDAIGPRGLIVIPQWAWGELQPANQRAIAEHIAARKVQGYAIQATDDEELNAEVYGANGK